METFNKKNGVSVRAYQGDAMTLLAFDLQYALRKNLAGFTIRYGFEVNGNKQFAYLYNRMIFPASFYQANQVPFTEKNSTLYAPIQKMNWVHVPNTNINTSLPIFGNYTYEITPRYIKNGVLLPLNTDLTVAVNIYVGPFKVKNTELGFTRGFVSSVAYAKRFNVKNNRVRPAKTKDELLFDVKQVADVAKRWNDTKKQYENVPYTFEEQHQWLGWQARERILSFLDEAVADTTIIVKAFVYDLNEPEICKRLLELGKQGRLQIILDNAGAHGDSKSMETAFERKFKYVAPDNTAICRGKFKALAHSKVFIQIKNNKAVKVLTGSTNFSTNGLYINSNHVLIFSDNKIASLYQDVFDASFGETNMKSFYGSSWSTGEFTFAGNSTPKMTITFAPHTKDAAQAIFDRIRKRILVASNTDVLFAIMKDTNASAILDAVREQVRNEKIFTYGITDSIGDDAEYSVFLYKPNALRGVRVAAKGISNTLPAPFGTVAGIDGYAIHHKFIVVNFKGKDPTVYCGSSNLSFTPEQKNGDNLLEIHDDDIVTAFAIEALRLVDHFHWRNNELSDKPMFLDDLSDSNDMWYEAWFNSKDLKNRQRKLYIKA
ncbi:MAG: phospholipase D-like domain-containing protein [Chitinophagales bacterium]